MKKIQYIVSPESGISFYRLVQPIGYLQMLESEWYKNFTWEMLWFIQDEMNISCDILVYNKYIHTPLDILKKHQANGMKIVVDVDDMWELSPSHPNYKAWEKVQHSKVIADHIRNADVVTCTSARLRDKLLELNKNVIIIPNAMPFGQENYAPVPHETSHKMKFIYAGGSTHLPDVKLLEGKFRKIGSDPFVKNNAEFILAGYKKAQGKQFFTPADRDANNSNFTIVEKSHKSYDLMKGVFAHTGSYSVIPSIHVNDYINVYNTADVSLIPLVDNSWNSYKSILKVLEAATRELPCIVSPVAPYTDELDENILWVKNNDWVEPIKWCIKNPVKAIDMGKRLSERIKKDYNLQTVNKKRIELFNSL